MRRVRDMTSTLQPWGDDASSWGDGQFPWGGGGLGYALPARTGYAGPTGTTTVSGARVGLGSVSIGSGLMQGTVDLQGQIEIQAQGSGVPFVVAEYVPIRRRASMSFETSGAAGCTLVAGPQTPVDVGFTFGGSGPTFAGGVIGFLTSVEYSFSRGGVAVCRQSYDAQDGIVTGTAGSESGSGTLTGLGTCSGGGGLLQAFTATAAGQFNEQWTGLPLRLRQRDVVLVEARAHASFANFENVPVPGPAGNIVYTHNTGGFTVTLANAVLTRAVTRFTRGGLAVLDCEWVGTGLAAG